MNKLISNLSKACCLSLLVPGVAQADGVEPKTNPHKRKNTQ